ncbi:MAG: hypothetical protein M0018_11500 [Nitrospiraceae bacterium]|nr:hypothetical protein [Nitrospiraceae bacterium]
MRVLAVLLLLLFPALIVPPAIAADVRKPDFRKNTKISEMVPVKPVRISLKRDARGGYSWEITGADTTAIIKADLRLRAYVRRIGAPLERKSKRKGRK